MASQKRRTAGTVIKTEDTQVHLDPGPGALVYSNKELEAPENTECVILSHGHLDHYGDAESILEMMTELNGHSGTLFGSESCLEGYGEISKSVSDYHQRICKRIETLEEEKEIEFKDLKIKSQQMFHSDPRTQGVILEDNEHKVGFWTDTRFSEELLDFYKGCDIMAVNCAAGKDSSSKKHTTVKEAVKVAEEIDPNATILKHFGPQLLDNLEENKEWVEKNTDQKIIWAEDGMEFPGNKSLDKFSS